MKECSKNKPVLTADSNLFYFEDGILPPAVEAYRHQLPWPFPPDESNIFLTAFFGSMDLVKLEHRHEGIDFHVKAGTSVICIEDGEVIYENDDERGFTFGDIYIQGLNTNIRYRYCHIELTSMPWDFRTFWNSKPIRPKVQAGQILGKVAPWFAEIPIDIPIPGELESLYGRKRDHLHLETSYSPYTFFSKNGLYDEIFNPLLLLQNPTDYFH